MLTASRALGVAFAAAALLAATAAEAQPANPDPTRENFTL
jgi:hypothetical protein